MDRLKKFIDQNKTAFKEPGPDREKLWSSIELRSSKRPSLLPKLLKVAAIGLILFGLGFIFGSIVFQNQMKPMYSSLENKEVYQMDHYYGNLIADQVNQLQTDTSIPATDKEELFTLLDQMELDYLELKKDLKNNINNEYILDAMATNYRNRLRILEQLNNQIPTQNEIPDEKYINL